MKYWPKAANACHSEWMYARPACHSVCVTYRMHAVADSAMPSAKLSQSYLGRWPCRHTCHDQYRTTTSALTPATTSCIHSGSFKKTSTRKSATANAMMSQRSRK